MSSPLYQPTFEMDQSFKDGARETFMRYASGGNQVSRQQVETVRSGNAESQRRYVTEISQTSNIGDGFKKMKFNQMETLKQLRQEYEILRNLPLQDQFLKHSHTKKQQSQYDQSRRESASVSSSSKQTDKKKHQRKQSSENVRSTQILTLEKRQLELVIGNSMRKIEELLNSQIEYKKIIHELQLQLDSRSTDDKIESLTKTMKRNESELNERIENLKREIQRLKQINKQLQQKNDLLEAELMAKNQQLRKYRDQKRGLEDQLRLQKDKFLSLEIDMKRIRMESELLEKEKNNEINRLNSLLQMQPKDQTATIELRRLEEDLRSQKQRYEILLGEFEKYKREVNDRPPREIIKEKNTGEDQMRIFEALIAHLREESANQNRASMDLFNSMVAKIDEKNEREKRKGSANDQNSSKLLEELFHLRNEVTSMKREKEVDKSTPLINNLAESMAEYQSKIRKLEDEIADGTITKENLVKQYEIIRSSLQYTRQQYDKLNIENQKLRERINHYQVQGQNSHEQLKGNFKERESQYEQTIRQLRRQLDEALFMVDKAKKEGEFNLGLFKGENQSSLRLVRDQVARVEGEKQLLRGELTKMKAYYEGKIQEKNVLIEKTASEFQVLCQTKEQTLVTYKANSDKQMRDLILKIESMAELNQRYLNQSTQMSVLEREVHQLRYALKRMKNMNDGVDHLWQIKETQYYNVNELLRQLKLS